MLEGLWTADFISNYLNLRVEPPEMGRFGGGAAVFETGRIFGGDSHYYYLGKYCVVPEQDGRIVEATIDVTHFHGAQESIFGNATQLSLSVRGTLADPMYMEGHVIGRDDLQITLQLIRRADLP